MGTYLDGVSAMSFSLRGHDLSGLAYSIPKPVLIILIVAMVVWIAGMLYRSKKMMEGHTSFSQFALVLISIFFAGFMLFMILKASFVDFGLP